MVFVHVELEEPGLCVWYCGEDVFDGEGRVGGYALHDALCSRGACKGFLTIGVDEAGEGGGGDEEGEGDGMVEDGAACGDGLHVAEDARAKDDAVEGCAVEAFCDEVSGGGVVEGEGFGGQDA